MESDSIGRQTSGEVGDPPSQIKPVSRVQRALHPSPSLRFPSSHWVAKECIPSPQIYSHTPASDVS